MKVKCSLSVLVLAGLLFSADLHAQFGVSFHQSNIPFVGINYEAGRRLLVEARIGADVYFEDLHLEAVGVYRFGRSEEVHPYIGLGARMDDANFGFGLLLPIGMNIYPFENKRFGFHIELAPIVAEVGVLRASWGIRYRFLD
jgi:hypothetical protein